MGVTENPPPPQRKEEQTILSLIEESNNLTSCLESKASSKIVNDNISQKSNDKESIVRSQSSPFSELEKKDSLADEIVENIVEIGSEDAENESDKANSSFKIDSDENQDSPNEKIEAAD